MQVEDNINVVSFRVKFYSFTEGAHCYVWYWMLHISNARVESHKMLNIGIGVSNYFRAVVGKYLKNIINIFPNFWASHVLV